MIIEMVPFFLRMDLKKETNPIVFGEKIVVQHQR